MGNPFQWELCCHSKNKIDLYSEVPTVCCKVKKSKSPNGLDKHGLLSENIYTYVLYIIHVHLCARGLLSALRWHSYGMRETGKCKGRIQARSWIQPHLIPLGALAHKGHHRTAYLIARRSGFCTCYFSVIGWGLPHGMGKNFQTLLDEADHFCWGWFSKRGCNSEPTAAWMGTLARGRKSRQHQQYLIQIYRYVCIFVGAQKIIWMNIHQGVSSGHLWKLKSGLGEGNEKRKLCISLNIPISCIFL